MDNTELSEGDKQKAAEWYPIPHIPGVPSIPPNPQTSGLPAPISIAPQPQIPVPPTLTGGIVSGEVEKDAPTDVSLYHYKAMPV